MNRAGKSILALILISLPASLWGAAGKPISPWDIEMRKFKASCANAERFQLTPPHLRIQCTRGWVEWTQNGRTWLKSADYSATVINPSGRVSLNLQESENLFLGGCPEESGFKSVTWERLQGCDEIQAWSDGKSPLDFCKQTLSSIKLTSKTMTEGRIDFGACQESQTP